jgi:hypothetical protein
MARGMPTIGLVNNTQAEHVDQELDLMKQAVYIIKVNYSKCMQAKNIALWSKNSFF